MRQLTPYQRTITALSVAAAFGIGFWSGFGSAYSTVNVVNGLLVIECSTDAECEGVNDSMEEAGTQQRQSAEARVFKF